MSSTPAPDAFEVGGLVLLSGLGRDDLAEHWIARDPAEGPLVHAVRLTAATLADAEATEAFVEHFEALFSVEHPGIVSVLETRREEGAVVGVLELVEAVTLRELIDAGDSHRLPVAVVLRIVHDVASALAAFENAGIVHGDLTPRSLRLLPGGVAVVVPSGLALAVCRLGESAPSARLAYKAPEQLATRASDSRSDVFALAACVYEALSGRFPFSGERRAIDGVPEPMLAVLERALDPDPEQRPPSASELSRLLIDAAGEREASRFELGELVRQRGAEPLEALRAEIEMATAAEPEQELAAVERAIDPNADLFEDTQPSLAKLRARKQARDRRRRLAILGVLAVAGVVAGIAFAAGRSPKSASLPAAAETAAQQPPAPRIPPPPVEPEPEPEPEHEPEPEVSSESEPAPPPAARPATTRAKPAPATKPAPRRSRPPSPSPARTFEIPAGI